MLSEKIGKKISETLFYRLKKKSKEIRGESEAWLDYYAKYQFVEYYRKRMEELELVQRKLLKALIVETEKKEKSEYKSLINQLSKTIGENSKILSEFGFAPLLLSRIKSLISENYVQRNEENKEVRRFKIPTKTQRVDFIFHWITKMIVKMSLKNMMMLRQCFNSI